MISRDIREIRSVRIAVSWWRKERRPIPAYHASTKLVNQKAATETEKGYSGDTWCNICNSIVEYGHDLPMIQKPKLEEFRITLPLPKDGDTGESKPHTMYTGSTVPSGGAGVPASAWYKWDAGLAKWTQFTETFRTGELYKAALSIYPSTSVKVTDQTKIYVNGELQAKTPKLILGKNMWHVEYQFRVTDEGGLPKVLKSFDAVIPRPLVGDSIMDIKVTDNTEGLEIYNVGWYLNPDGTCTWPYKGSWKKSSKGWWFGDTSGWYAKNETLRIDGKSYTFDAKGYLKE
ncbi:MAG: hypothetical protein IJM25_04835 [Eubacterium sp.]|nr:hypothetical protein [Eubacterium sp.]